MAISLKSFIGTSTTDQNYANSVARWLSVRTENAQNILSSATSISIMSPSQVSDYVDSLDSEMLESRLILFSEDSTQAAKSFTVEDVLKAYGGCELQNITQQEAELIMNDLAGSTAAITAAAIGVNELCAEEKSSTADFVASIEAQVGGISDQMLSVTGVLAPIFSSSKMALRDKVTTVLRAIGLIRDEAYTGFGPLNSELHDMTGLSGAQAVVNVVDKVITAPAEILMRVTLYFAAFINKVFGGLFSKAAAAVGTTVSTIVGTNDACTIREEGKYTDLSCDNANMYFQFSASNLTSSQREKISYQYAMHFDLGFGTADLWYDDSTQTTVNCVLHWKPINSKELIQWVNDRAQPATTWTSMTQVYHDASNFDEFFGNLLAPVAEASDSGTPAVSEERFEEMAAIFNTAPVSGSAGIDDGVLYDGIHACQLLTVAMLTIKYVDGSQVDLYNMSTEMANEGLDFYMARPSNIRNVDIANAAAMKNHTRDLKTDLDTGYLRGCLLNFIRDILTEVSSFSVLSQDSFFVPYFYVSSFMTGKYSILSDAQVQKRIENALLVVGTVIVTVLAIRGLLSIKKKLWIAQTSLDYRSFEVDVATNAAAAEVLYKDSCRLARANALIAIVTGSAKSLTSRLCNLVVGLGNTITSKVGSLVGTGHDNTDSSSAGLNNLQTVINLIKG